MKYCNICGAELEGNEKFCGKCGTKIEEALVNNLDNLSTNAEIESTDTINKPQNSVDVSESTSDTSLNDNNIPTKNYNNPNSITIEKNNKKMSNNSKAIIALVIIIIAGVIGAKFYLTEKYSPENTVKEFEDAINEGDDDKLLDILYTDSSSLYIDETTTKAIIDLLSTDNVTFESVKKRLTDDILNIEKSYSTESTTVSGFDFFTLKLIDENFFFKKYAILVKPIDISITTNYIDATVGIDSYDVESLNFLNNYQTITTLAPGKYDICFKSTDSFDEEIYDKVSVDTVNFNNNYDIIGFENYSFYQIESNVPNSAIVINGKNTGITAISTLENPLLLNKGDSITLSYTINDKEYTTSAVHAGDYSSYMYLEFNYSDYSEISTFSNNYTGSNDNTANEVNDNTPNEVNENSDEANFYIDKYNNVDYIIPTSNTKEIVFKDLNDYSIEELFLARNEILARYGYTFDNYPNLRAYFDSKTWYEPCPSFSGEVETELEKNNLDIIGNAEFRKMARDKCPDISADYVFPNSNKEELKSSDVRPLNDWELIIARNEIFARYGLSFSSIEILNHFKSKSWFVIDPSVGNDMELSDVEYKNVQTILAEELYRRENTLNHDLGY